MLDTTDERLSPDYSCVMFYNCGVWRLGAWRLGASVWTSGNFGVGQSPNPISIQQSITFTNPASIWRGIIFFSRWSYTSLL